MEGNESDLTSPPAKCPWAGGEALAKHLKFKLVEAIYH
jgi:hypothetical protein